MGCGRGASRGPPRGRALSLAGLGLGLRQGLQGLRARPSRQAVAAATPAPGPDGPGRQDRDGRDGFSHPHVMSRLERLMGTNVVRITDRKYMLELQRRIREDHVRIVRERIRAREVDELEREKKLILDGRMSLDEAPKELIDHPVFQISQFIKNVLLGGKIPGYLKAARNHVQPARLCQMASCVSRSSSSRGILATSRSLLASEDAGDRGPTTPTTLAAAASRPASTSLSASSRASTPSASRKGSARSEASARPEGADDEAAEAAEADEADQVTDAEVEAALAQAAKTGPAKETEAEIIVRVEDAEEAGEDEDGDDEALSGMSACDFEEDFDRQADVERGYMFTQEDFDRIKFEAESVKKMWELETVEELYALAESIVKEMVAQGGGAATPAPGAKPVSPSPSRRPSINPAPADS